MTADTVLGSPDGGAVIGDSQPPSDAPSVSGVLSATERRLSRAYGGHRAQLNRIDLSWVAASWITNLPSSRARPAPLPVRSSTARQQQPSPASASAGAWPSLPGVGRAAGATPSGLSSGPPTVEDGCGWVSGAEERCRARCRPQMASGRPLDGLRRGERLRLRPGGVPPGSDCPPAGPPSGLSRSMTPAGGRCGAGPRWVASPSAGPTAGPSSRPRLVRFDMTWPGVSVWPPENGHRRASTITSASTITTATSSAAADDGGWQRTSIRAPTRRLPPASESVWRPRRTRTLARARSRPLAAACGAPLTR